MLYARYYRYLFRFVYRITRRLDLIEEIINDAMFVVWQKAGTVEARSTASTWILGIAYHKSLKALHDSHGTSNDVPLDESEHGLPGDDGTMMHQLDVENLAEVALGALSPDQRAVMELAYYQEMHYGEIAEVLGCPENTVKTRMFHARKKLRSLLPALLGGTCAKPRQESMP
jgi:RNA polymerase sigma factor (sigma-70 family)